MATFYEKTFQSQADFQDVCSELYYQCAVVDETFFDITLKPHAELKKQHTAKLPSPYRDQTEQIFDD